MTVSSLYLYNDFVKKIYFFYSCLCGKTSNPQKSCKNSTVDAYILFIHIHPLLPFCHIYFTPTHTYFFFWGTIWGLVAVCHFNTSAYVSWEQVIFFFNLSTITWETNLTYNSIIKRIVHIQISPVVPWCSYSFIYTYVCVYILYI